MSRSNSEDLTIRSRLGELLGNRDRINTLLSYMWNDKCIANYMATDQRTVRRFRRMVKMFGPEFCEEEAMEYFGY